jgi:alpha-L-fucosidase 2
MKHKIKSIVCLTLLTACASSVASPLCCDAGGLKADAPAPVDNLVIWDNLPASDFEVAYPVGSGRLGAMPYAEFPKERILINEETIWKNARDAYLAEDIFPHLEKIRELEAAGDYKEADEYFLENISKEGSGRKRPQSYQLAGFLELDYQNTAAIEHTLRSLDLQTGIASNIYTLADGSKITQKVTASAVDDLIAVHIQADQPIQLVIGMEGAAVEGSDLVLNSKGDGKLGTQFQNRARVIHPAGAVVAEGNHLKVTDATDITFYFTVATNFNRQNSAEPLADGWQANTREILDAVQGRGFESVAATAIADHQSFFNRLNFDIGTTSPEVMKLPTKDRLQRLKDGAHDDPDLMETYFQFGRYLLIASSRPGGLPANLQGVWNDKKQAPWSSDYHLNINLQMNYWLAETCNLSELHEPVFTLLRMFQPTGKEMTRRMGMKGWAMGHATDVWGSARNMGMQPRWSASFLSGQWLTFHILEHYRFTRDPQVLADNWDILTASTEFCVSWLIPGPNDTLIARPGTSPENTFTYTDKDGETQEASISAGVSADQWKILQVFKDYVQAATALGKLDDPLVQQVQKLIPRIYRPKVGADGRLMEWMHPFGEAEPGHRHISHVIGAYPGNVIDLDDDPIMRDAVTKSIDGRLSRGGAGTGWSRAWTIGMYARFSDGEKAYDNFHAILTKSTLDNLWDNHPPFQIDGNFGATAAVAEMLLHSHNDEIKLLPALPSQWSEGSVQGLRARGDYTVDISWANGELVEALIQAGELSEGKVRFVYQGKSIEREIKPGKSVRLNPGAF